MPQILSFHGPDGSRLGQFRLAGLESCFAIVGPPERASRAARGIGSTGHGFRIELFSAFVGPGEESGQAETDIDRLATPVSSSYIGRVLLATPVGEQERIAAVVRQLEGTAADVGLIVLEGASADMRFGAQETSVAPRD